MIIGTIREVKDNENRVGLIPDSVRKLVKAGHKVIVQSNAGKNAGFSNQEYKKAGAAIYVTPRSVIKACDILVKVKEPIRREYLLLKYLKDKTLYTYLHLAAVDRSLTKTLLKYNITSVAYETVEDKKGNLPLLKPMSEVAGVLAIQYAAQYLQRKYDGRGVSLGRIENTDPATVVVVGPGTVGMTSAITALGLGCKVIILGKHIREFSQKKKVAAKAVGNTLVRNLRIIESNPSNLMKAVKQADVLVGAVLVPGAKAPVIVARSMVDAMKQGAVIVDVAIDQGGCIWGSKPTSHSDPIYHHDGKIYCNITNMPGQVPRQSAQALNAATIPYLLKMVKGVEHAMRADKNLAKGLNTYKGKITYRAVAEALKMEDDFQEFKNIK